MDEKLKYPQRLDQCSPAKKPFRTERNRMPILLAITSFCFAIYFCCVVAQPKPTASSVNLNAPGAIERLRLSNPDHYKKIGQITRGLPNVDREDGAHSNPTIPYAKSVSFSPLLLTSDPPQRQLSFILDDTSYYGRVTLEDRSGTAIYPTRNP